MDPQGPLSKNPGNPLDLLEQLVIANDWTFDRHDESELMVEVEGRWSSYFLHFAWRQEVGAIFFSCHFDLRVPKHSMTGAREMIAAFNERLWLGHFDLLAGEGETVFRHTVPLRGTAGASVEQLEDLVDTAVAECERLYPAIQMLVWGGRSVEEAMGIALLDTVGEA